MATIIPVSAVIPTKDRAEVLYRTLGSLLNQSHIPAELIIIDASAGNETEKSLREINLQGMTILYLKAEKKGAAVQRIQGTSLATQQYIFFMDDDLVFEKDCIARIWLGMSTSDNVGAINAMITNQKYTAPGFLSRTMYRLFSRQKLSTYAGKLIGPAWNLLPEDRDELPEYMPCEWLNTTCTFYRRAALPVPLFDDYFRGYSMLEDVALSFRISRNWTLLNARTARIFHDSQPGDHKDSIINLSEMELRNRHYVMTRVMGRDSFGDYLNLALYQVFSLLSCFRSFRTIKIFPLVLIGKVKALVTRRK